MSTLALVLVAALALGEGARLPPPGDPAPAAAASRTGDEIAFVRAEVDSLSAGGPKAREPLAAERRAVLEVLLASLELRRLRAEGGSREPLPRPPPSLGVQRAPYPVSLVDAARDHVDGLVAEKATLEAARQSLAQDEETLLSSLKASNEQQRLWQERAAAETRTSAKRLAVARAELARWRARQAALQLADTREANGRATERAAAIGAQLAEWQPRVAELRRSQRLDDATMADALDEVAREREALAMQMADVDVRAASDSTAAGQWTDVAVLMRERDVVLRGREDVWRLRQRVLADAATDPGEQARILDDAISQLDARLRWGKGQLAFYRASGAAAGSGPDTLEAEAALLQARQQLVDTLARSKSLLEWTRDDLSQAGASGAAAGTVRGWLLAFGGLVRKVWETELFVVTDTLMVEGREITRELGITVGKSLGAAFLLAFGFAAIRWLALPALAWVLEKTGASAARRRTVSRWVSGALFALLVVVVLKLARIPLVAFAFLGGALAIGIGFGAQTLLRNLMSGLMLLVERKVKVGDVLTLGATSGTCADVGWRATTLHGFDGIDVIIPNSTLLENPIQNWRSRDARIRREVRLFVPYSSTPAEAAAIMQACALAEAAILRDPAPEVLLAGLGEGGFELVLQFWLRLGIRPYPPTVESQLRFAISRALRDAGIELGTHSSVRTIAPA